MTLSWNYFKGPAEGQSMQQKDDKRRKRKGTQNLKEKRKALSLSQNFDSGYARIKMS